MKRNFTFLGLLGLMFTTSFVSAQSTRLSQASGLVSNPVLLPGTQVLNPCSEAQPGNALEDGRISLHDIYGNLNQSADDIFVPANTCMTIYMVKSNHFVVAPPSSVNIYFFDDAGGAPGNSINTQTGVSFTTSYVGSNYGLDVYEVSSTITAVDLCGGPSGTRYWFSVTLATGFTDCYWEFQTVTQYGLNGMFIGPDFGEPSWTSFGDNFVFSLEYTYRSELEDTLTICSGNSVVIGGQNVSTPGLYMDTLTTVTGCDSIAPVRLANYPAIVVNIDAPLSTTFCTSDNSVPLTATPFGGAFSGPGMTGNIFDPVAANSGQNEIVYAYADTNGCGTSDTLVLTVNPLPSVTFDLLLDSVCVDAAPFTLSGVPTGGTFSGPGVSGNIFTASVANPGVHELVYSYTDGNGCSNTDTSYITVNACLGMNPASAATFACYPNPTNGMLQITGNLEGAQAEIRDMTGRIILNRVLNTNTQSFDLSNLAAGTYLIQVSRNGEVSSQPVILTR